MLIRTTAVRPTRNRRGAERAISRTVPARPVTACSVILLLAVGVLGASDSAAQARTYLPGTIADPAAWRGAAPAGPVVNGVNGPELVIRQTTPRATLDWMRFDIRRGETVRFDQQGNRDWAALNRVLDPTGRPSEIAGRLVADGQVYLINQNGIVFRPTAQVDVHSLIASTLNINPDAFVRGLLSVRQGTAQFDVGSGNRDASIRVEGIRGPDGRTLVQAATLRAQDGGRIFLLAAREVINEGRLEVRDGQIVLAAGERVYLFAPAEGGGTGLRGLFVEVDGGRQVTNLGEIMASRGNATMIGLAVNQSGRISANSAEVGNGSVWLLARSGLRFDESGSRSATTAGTVTLSPDSVTELRPQSSGTGVVDSVSLNPSQVRIEGARIHLQGDGTRGAQVVAPGGQVSVIASAAPGTIPLPNAREPVAPTDSRLLIDGGAKVDVSGLRDVEVPVSRNVVAVELRGDVVADAPLLRDGPLFGQTLNVDVRAGSPLFGGADTVQRVAASQVRRSIDERSTTGGTISLQSDGDLVVNPGARFAIAGGIVRYTPAELRISRLSDGAGTVSVSQAAPERAYTFVVDRFQTFDARWNVRRTFESAYRYPIDPGYVEGRPAGSLTLNAPWVRWAGSVEADVLVGREQFLSPPLAGLFGIGERTQIGQRFADYRVLSPLVLTAGLADELGAVGIDQARASVFGSDDAPLAQRIDGAALVAGGVSRVELLSNTSIAVPAGAPLVLPVGGRLLLSANRVEVGRDVVVPAARGEAIALPSGAFPQVSGIEITAPITAGNVDPQTGGPVPDAVGTVRIAPGVAVDAAARWVVEPVGTRPASTSQGWLRDGGSVRIAGATEVSVADGARLDASGGGLRDASRRLVGGDGGRIALQVTGRGDLGDPPPPAAGSLTIDGVRLQAYGFRQNGTLRLDSPNVTVAAQAGPPQAGWLPLTPALFESGAFSRYEINATDTLRIGAVRLAPRQSNYVADQRQEPTLSAELLRALSAPRTLDDQTRRPVSMAFAATSPYRASLTVERGAVIDADPRASLRFNSDYRLAFDGIARAPGGTIDVGTGRAARSVLLPVRADEVLRVGSDARLDAAGVDLTVADAAGRRTGAVVAGGTVDIAAQRGALAIEPGATIDVSGARGTRIAVSTDGRADAAPVPTALGSDAGRVSITAGAGGYAAPAIWATPGSAAAAGATIEIRHAVSENDAAPSRVLSVTDATSVRSNDTAATTDLVTAPAVRRVDADTGAVSLDFRVSRRTLEPAGTTAGAVTLAARDRVVLERIDGITATRSLTLSSAELALAGDRPDVRIASPSVEIGQPVSQSLPVIAVPTPGNGRLTIDAASTVDFVGRVALSGVRQVDVRSGGDVRLLGQYPLSDAPRPRSEGELSFAGSLSLTANRVYPTTLSDYVVRSTAAEGRIELRAAGAESGPPLSALGSLTLRADAVAGDARLYAPLGAISIEAVTGIELGAASIVSVSGEGALVPVGQSLSGFDWVYQVDRLNRAPLPGLPAKAVTLDSARVDVREGARIDLRGGGDMLGREFVRGQSGATDILQAPNVFAVLPNGVSSLPRDTSIEIEDSSARTAATAAFRGALPTGATVSSVGPARAGDTLTVTGSPMLAAGTYTLLPARYGHLPGARVVVIAQGAAAPRDATALNDGSWWVAGYRGNASGERDPTWSSVAVLDAAALGVWSRYDLATGTSYFGSRATSSGMQLANAPADAGRLTVSGSSRAALSGALTIDGGAPLTPAADGTIATGAVLGQRGELELVAGRLRIGAGVDGTDAVSIAPGFLADLRPRTLSLGIATGTDGTRTIRSTEVVLDPGVSVSAEQVIIGASERIALGAGATVSAIPGTATPRTEGATATRSTVAGNGAVIAALGDAGTRLGRTEGAVPTGQIDVGAGARLAGGAVELGADRLAVSPAATIEAPDVRLAATRLRFGSGDTPDPAVSRFDAAQTAALSGRERFDASAATEILLAGTVTVGGAQTTSVRLEAPVIARDPSAAPGTATVRAGRVEIAGGADPTGEGPIPAAGPPAGDLAVIAGGAIAAARSGLVLSGHAVLSGFGRYGLVSEPAGGAAGRIVLDGRGSLRTDGALTLTADAVVGAPAADFALAVGGALVTRAAGTAAVAPAQAGAGARIDVSAASIDHGSTFAAPSGSLTLRATGTDANGSVTLRSNASLDASGASRQVFDQALEAGGGRIVVSSAAGSVIAERGAALDVSAAASAEGGSIRLSAPSGRIDAADASLRGARTGDASSVSGSALQVDARTIERPTGLLGQAGSAGFTRAVELRQRAGDLSIGSPGSPVSLGATSIELAADAGRLDLTGTLSGVGEAPSRIALHAGDRVALGNGTRLTAAGGTDGSATGRGGAVVLSGANGFAFGRDVRIAAGAATSPASGSQADGGRIELRFDAGAVPSLLEGGAAPAQLSASGGRVALTGVQRIAVGNTLGTAQVESTRAASEAFVAQRDTIVAALGLPTDTTAAARPELLFTGGTASSPLVVNQNINLANYRVAGQAGVLTVRALGDLELTGRAIVSSRGLSAVVSDGFTDGGARAAQLADPESWSLRFVAGADPRAANAMAVATAAAGGDLLIAGDRAVRTGTGSISLAASRDVRIGRPAGASPETRDAAVYTAGRPAPAIAAFVLPPSQQRPAYATGGGDVTVSAGRDVVGAESGQLASNWLPRRGELDAEGRVPVREDGAGGYAYAGTTWGPRFDVFRQSVGALGGGSVAVTAGRDVSNISVAVPTNARYFGPADRLDAAAANLSMTELGGGGARVEAGRDVVSGAVMLQRGAGTVRAGRDVVAGRDVFGLNVGTIVTLGNAALTVEAAGDARLERVIDPLMLPQPAGAQRTYFSAQGDATRLTLRAAGGDASLRSDDSGGTAVLSASGVSTLTGDSATGMAFGPHTLSIEALSRDVIMQNVDVRLAPYARGDLRLIAAGNVEGREVLGFAPGTAMLDYDPTVLFAPRAPVPEAALDAALPSLRLYGTRSAAASPLHAGDPGVARLYAGTGDVAFSGQSANSWLVDVAKPVEVRAGRDVANLTLGAKHPDSTDRSVVAAGRDIVNPVPRTLANEIAAGGSRVRIGGAGLLEMIAGRDIKLGSGAGVETRGNLDDSALPVNGASIVMVAGLPDGPDYGAFLDAYAAPGASRGRGYAAELDAFLRTSGVPSDGLDPAGRWAALRTLPQGQQAVFARQVFFIEIRESGRAAADPASPVAGDYQRAYDAIATLFPKDGQGNIELVFSKVRTERGGDVQLLAPGVVCRGAYRACDAGADGAFVGNIVAGLLTPQPIRSASVLTPTDFGILTLGGGNVQGIAGNDFSVNQSRVFTVAGGDILLWSSFGDIDAGRGSRTAIASPPPIVTVDAQGNIRVEVPGAASGSGIGTLITRTDTPPGSVDLYAPRGAIDAGEAGIRISGSAFLGASEIRNAGAISAAGPSVGVPTASTASNVSLASAGASSASATRVASDTAERDANEAGSRRRSSSRVLILEFLGFGDEGEEAYRRRQQRGR